MSPTEGSDASRWERVQEVFAEALELDPDVRAAFLEERCAGDADLRAEVESLLEAADASDDYFGDLAGRAGLTLGSLSESSDGHVTAGDADAGKELIGQTVGQYHILDWLGRGGMASVYLAERKGAGFTQTVALKLVLKKLSDPSTEKRTTEERGILARLEHRGIARLIDGGVTPDGLPFYAMEYVDGRDILTHCDKRRLTVRERLELFLEVCAPVQFAHERLIVHCDLKPSNIFVSEEGHVKLLDFGVARLIDPDAEGDAVTGLWFTPAYASPEQVRREQPSAASDVYSLGILLYEMLTGHRPYRFSSKYHQEVERVVGGVVPPAPSEIVTQPTVRTKGTEQTEITPESLSSARASTPEAVRRSLKGDVDAIVMKALAKDPFERYTTVASLAADIRRHLSHRPVSCVPATRQYRATKFVRRYRGPVAAAAMLAVAVSSGLGASLWQANRAAEAAALAQDEAEKAALVSSLMRELFRLSDPNEALGDTITARDLLDRGTARVLTELNDQPVVQADLLTEVAAVYRNLGLYRRAEPLAVQALELREQQFGLQSLEVSESLIQVGSLQRDLGLQAEAIETLSRAIDVRQPLVEHPDPGMIEAQRLLGWVARDDQQYERAAALFQQALDAQNELDPDAPEVADLVFGLASAYHDSGMLDEADALLETALITTSGSASPMAVDALRNMGMIRRLREQYRPSEPLLRRALEMAETLYGPTHPEVFDSKQELGLTLLGTGQWDEAESLLREAVLASGSALGTQHQRTAQLQEALATLLVDREEYEEAVILHQLALEEKIRRHANRDHPGVVASLVRVAEALTGAGRFPEARDYIAQAQSMSERLGPGPSVYSIAWERALGKIAAASGEAEAAEEHFVTAVTRAEELLARPDHRYTVWAKRDYALFLTGVGRNEEAAALLEWVVEAQRASLGEPHPQIDRSRAALRAARNS